MKSRLLLAVAAFIILAGTVFGISAMNATPARANNGCPTPYFPMGIHNGGNYLDDYGGGSGTYVHTYPHTGSPNQTWCPQFASEGGIYLHPMNNQGLCLDAHTDQSGQRIWVYTCNGTAPQRWCWDSTISGYIIRPNHSAALQDNGTYNVVTIAAHGANSWASSMSSIDGSC
jgi:hypothetical protein